MASMSNYMNHCVGVITYPISEMDPCSTQSCYANTKSVGTTFNNIWIKLWTFSLSEMHLESSANSSLFILASCVFPNADEYTTCIILWPYNTLFEPLFLFTKSPAAVAGLSHS